jgi:hypothetical protein
VQQPPWGMCLLDRKVQGRNLRKPPFASPREHGFIWVGGKMVGRETDHCVWIGRSYDGLCLFNPDGSPPNSCEYNALVRECLKRIQLQSPDLFSITEDLLRYGISRTYRKSAESRTRKAGIKEEDVKIMNRWRVTEQTKGKQPRRAMVDHYADARALVSVTWRCSYAL